MSRSRSTMFSMAVSRKNRFGICGAWARRNIVEDLEHILGVGRRIPKCWRQAGGGIGSSFRCGRCALEIRRAKGPLDPKRKSQPALRAAGYRLRQIPLLRQISAGDRLLRKLGVQDEVECHRQARTG